MLANSWKVMYESERTFKAKNTIEKAGKNLSRRDTSANQVKLFTKRRVHIPR